VKYQFHIVWENDIFQKIVNFLKNYYKKLVCLCMKTCMKSFDELCISLNQANVVPITNGQHSIITKEVSSAKIISHYPN
jgi:hypothetical protein